MSRQERKLEHLQSILGSKPSSADFSEITLIHNCLPEIGLNSLDMTTAVAGIKLPFPLFINALTGGVSDAESINAKLAEAAAECRLPLAVGSQMAALENPEYRRTFTVVREKYPRGIVFANIGAYADTDLALRAVEMINADALQVHLNAPQELLMPEGDKDFRGWRKRIAAIVRAVSVPVIVKEVRFGIAREQAKVLQDLGVAAIDISGRGGTNFLQIESLRSRTEYSAGLMNWGIPTPLAILEAKTGAPQVDLIASGGIVSGLAVAKSIALGAKAAAVAGAAIRTVMTGGTQALVEKLRSILHELKLVMVMTGCKSIDCLRKTPLVITGKTREWMIERSLNR